ncbi:uncharacterized protein LOC134372541 [Cynocephalus volans]|uniref:uncharacterized protein LOC134372541 n=1 Tax=Cynocephalus volans TaxID=110931 RepID=UPI002FCACC3A
MSNVGEGASDPTFDHWTPPLLGGGPKVWPGFPLIFARTPPPRGRSSRLQRLSSPHLLPLSPGSGCPLLNLQDTSPRGRRQQMSGPLHTQCIKVPCSLGPPPTLLPRSPQPNPAAPVPPRSTCLGPPGAPPLRAPSLLPRHRARDDVRAATVTAPPGLDSSFPVFSKGTPPGLLPGPPARRPACSPESPRGWGWGGRSSDGLSPSVTGGGAQSLALRVPRRASLIQKKKPRIP